MLRLAKLDSVGGVVYVVAIWSLAAYITGLFGVENGCCIAYTRTSICIGASIGMYISCMLVPKQHLNRENPYVWPLEVPPCTLSLVVPTRLSHSCSRKENDHSTIYITYACTCTVDITSTLYTCKCMYISMMWTQTHPSYYVDTQLLRMFSAVQ